MTKTTHKTRDFKASEYDKTVGIKKKNWLWLDQVRGKKSKAGKLDEIIEFYKANKKV